MLADRARLLTPEIGEGYVGVPLRNLDHLGAARLGGLRGHVPGALPMPDHGKPLELFHASAHTRERAAQSPPAQTGTYRAVEGTGRNGLWRETGETGCGGRPAKRAVDGTRTKNVPWRETLPSWLWTRDNDGTGDRVSACHPGR
ncbi:hypothetical protein Ade02nite_83630 [Paractinoplanes deccanensis]|uniref:Uncharacterized protein n=1 Tax=Paractinoplanes deccanensis TaxID=113561 RepID=A0ABQ3YIA0_9ACTN|nr:hypothetical protein Ade02nite_83630 [Actinoplanes deccanensis]